MSDMQTATAPAPAWFAPLSVEDRQQFVALFERATGCQLVAPSAEAETPAVWISEVSMALVGQMRAMQEAMARRERALRNNPNRPPLVYDPKYPHDER